MPRENSGSMRRNEKKESDKHPDMKGKCNIAGIDYWLSGWVKESDDGRWISLSFQPMDAKPAPKPKPAAPATPLDDDELPF